ncbi:MAG: RNA-binding protein [Candidatus Roizmanbacteria bacterium]|nr:RNA-binding protein [Candidatus Roizmanbacteria bacterium]
MADSQQTQDGDSRKLYVGNLPWSMTNDSLKELFSQFGEVVEAIVITDRMTGKSKGFGFVTFADEKAAAAAVEKMHRSEVDGRNIVVNVARPREERPRQ